MYRLPHDDIGLVSLPYHTSLFTIFVHIMSTFNVTVAVNRKLDIWDKKKKKF